MLLVVVPVAGASAAPSLSQCSDAPVAGLISHDLSSSYCELCGIGEITITISNQYDVDVDDVTITEDLRASGLTYVPGSTTYSVNGGGSSGGGDPAVNGPNGSVLTWTPADIPALSTIAASRRRNVETVEITFQVRRHASLDEEGLVTASRLIEASMDYSLLSCADPGPWTDSTGSEELPIREPEPNLIKLGRNVDAAQNAGSYGDPVYGHIHDDVIWRIEITNGGLAGLQDLKFDDLMASGNFQINYACPSEGDATAVANNDGSDPGGTDCVAASNTISDFIVDDPFGSPGNDEPTTFIDVPAGGSAYVYLVGKITTSCVSNKTNTVSNLEWGCEVDAPDGGISTTSSGASAGSATATLSSLVVNNNLNIVRALTGTNTGQPVGSKGTMTITITNNTGGTVKNIKLRDVLPVEYVMDPTYTPTLNVTPMYGAYDGMIDTITWTNPAPVSMDPADPLSNTAPEFELTSTTVHPDYGGAPYNQFNMLRHGDRAVITFRVVMIEAPDYYDLAANVDVREENIADATDPDNATALVNELYVDFEELCNPGTVQQASSYPFVDNVASDPEDIDIDITGNELIFILTNDPTQPLPLQVSLSNNGGHDAADYFAYVTFGATMDVVNWPAGCSITTNPPPLAVWEDPAAIPGDATVFECTGNVIRPGRVRRLDFEVIKSSDPADLTADDLSFRADVIGEITLSDGTPLWFPTPDTSVINNRANNYTLDAIRARVIGFNLTKNLEGFCSENNPPPSSPDDQVEIGEECSYRILTGGWFGFQTPGFVYIAVQRIQVVDEIPDGQGYISSTDPALTSDPTILGISLNPPGLSPLDEGWFDWTFNQVVPGERITVKDQWFQVDATTRLLNDPLNDSNAPNQHAAISRNVLSSYFQAVFNDALTGLDQIFDLGPNAIGYPQEVVRRVDLTVTEPNILVDKKVCNETRYGVGTACSNFVDLTDEGDTYDSYVYQITLTNQASSAGVGRAPAYDVTSTDLLDSSDLMYVVPFSGDGLDNDGDGLTDGADANGEGSISDNALDNGVPAEITFTHSHSDPLLKIDAGDTVTFYYRVDPDPRIAPQQQLTNTVSAIYDSLEGDSGNQTVVPGATGETGGARLYTSSDATATVEIVPLQTQPKEIIDLSNTPPSGGPTQAVSIGEEIEYELRTFIPVANLRSFSIWDNLPAGMSCIEAPDMDLGEAPYDVAGFSPGGRFTPDCNGGSVVWDFGDQTLTNTSIPGSLFEFPVTFIARVDNIGANDDGDILSNGDPATVATVSYIDETGSTVTLDFGQIDVVVREPLIVLTKSLETGSVNAGDVLTVSVTAENVGTADAYNLRVLDDLVAAGNLTFVGNVSGADPPDTIDTATLGANRPIFSWNSSNPKFAIPPGETRAFSFEVSVDIGVQPHEVLANTIESSWTSLPDSTTALNSGGSIGADGTAGGMRNGRLPNAADPINDYEATTGDAASVPALSLTKTDLDPGLPPEIGAHKHFEVEITLPEGTVDSLAVSDDLADAGLSYVLSNNANFDVAYTFSGIDSINGQPPAEAVFNAFPSDNTSGTAVWDIGTVVTQSEDDTSGAPAITPTIGINYYARINNDLNTNVGNQLRNDVTVNYTNGETGGTETLTDSTATVTVTESDLTLSKTVSNVTPLPVTGGDILAYEVTIGNTGDATAYDINIVDTLPPELELDGGFSPTATVDGIPVAGFVSGPAGTPGGPLVWGRGNGDGSLDLPAGSTLVLYYQALVQSAQPNDSLSNEVWVDWTSLQDGSVYERTGAGCPTITAPDDYCVGPSTTTTDVGDTTTLIKSVLSDSYDVASLSTANDAILRVGDTVTYELALNLQEGVTRQVAVQDQLPAGMAFSGIVSINGDNTADYTAPASGAGSNFSYAAIGAGSIPSAGQTGTLTWTLGTVTNDPMGDGTTDTLTIIYDARVIEDTLAHTDELTLDNLATLAYVDGDSNPVVDPARLESGATITVRQPIMDSLTKIDRSGRVSGSSVFVGYEVINFRVTACNTSGLAPAYSVMVTDDLASQFDESTIAGPVNGAGQPDVYVGGVLLSEAADDYAYTPPAGRGGTMEFLLDSPVDPGQCVNIDYDIGFYDDFPADDVWNNSVTLDEYYSLPLQSGQRYPGLGPVTFTLTNTVPQDPPQKTLISPLTGEVTVGDEIVYQITVPGVSSSVDLFNVNLTDTLDDSLLYLGATEISGNGLTFTDNSTLPNQVDLVIDTIPTGQQAVIEVRVRVDNNDSANAGVGFDNTASYTYPLSPGGPQIFAGSGTTATSLTIVEPAGALSKQVTNLSNPGSSPTAGDVLRYTLTIDAGGGAAGDNFSDMYDLVIADTLGIGLVYNGNVSVTGPGNSIDAPGITGDGVTSGQVLDWNASLGNVDIDVAEGSGITVSYDVLVLDSALAAQDLTNAAVVRWTGQDGIDANERDGSGSPAANDYFTAPASVTVTTPVTNTLAKSVITDTWGAADTDVRIGDIVEYELRLQVQEGTSANAVITDTLPRGMSLEEVVSINGDTTAPFGNVAPFVHNDIVGPSISGDPLTGPTTVTWTLGDLINSGDNDDTNDEFVIVYRARILDQALVQSSATTLTNTAQFSYDAATGTLSDNASQNLNLLQPILAVSKSAVAAGGDTELLPGELVTYTVDIANSGSAPAYDVVLTDIIPPGMRYGAATITMVSTELIGSATSLPDLDPDYDPASGVATWDLDDGVYAIPAADTLRVVYQVQTDDGLGAGLTLTNQAVASRYHSFDDEAVPTLGGVTGVREVYGPTQTASTTLTTAAPGALAKDNPAEPGAAIGETFVYRITVPAVPVETALYDVRILDDLSASAADLEFVDVTRVSGSQAWTPVNTGSATNLVIEDTTDGIDIPAGEQIVIDITVVLLDTAVNVSGLKFANTSSYTFNALDEDDTTEGTGGAATTADMTIVGPDSVTLQKSGPVQLDAGVAGTFTIDVQNTGTGTAWDLTITDLLPNTSPGGMCDVPPSVLGAQVFASDGVTGISPPLEPGTDFSFVFAADPDCTLTVTMLTPIAAIGPGERLIATYEAMLDADNAYAASLTNIAAATEWYSADTAGAGNDSGQRQYTRSLTDGTVDVLDHEDAHTLMTEPPSLSFQQTVINASTGEDTATPGDTLRYRMVLQNTGGLPLAGFTLFNELDALNGVPLYQAGTLTLISTPPGADGSGTDPNGGAAGSGLLDIGELYLDPAGGADDSLTIEYEVALVPVITNDTLVLNQTALQVNDVTLAQSDDPDINGADDPDVFGDEDPTEIRITSAPDFEVWKISDDVTGDPAELIAGDTLRYTITVKNVGTENAIGVVLRDQLPANTTYVGDSTTLNGEPVADGASGIMPLQDGMSIRAPVNSADGEMPADATDTTDNVATITFDVTINPDVINGAIIANQGILTADGENSGPTPEVPSDDPDTPVLDDPTRDVVGNLPLLDVQKTVEIQADGGSPGIVDPGDTLRYTLTVWNFGAIPATGVSLVDEVPANTTYVADSVRLNGEPVGQPDGGTSPLVSGIAVSSPDLTPPLPSLGEGIVSPGQSAVVTFDVRVDAGTAKGTIISNQGFVGSEELADEPSDADGIDSNGDQPTDVVVGDVQQLSITKEVSVVGGGVAEAGNQLEYVIRVQNLGSLPATDVRITDNLDLPAAGQLIYVPGSATLDGSTAGVSFTAPVLDVDYAAVYGDMPAGTTAVLRFRATIDDSLAIGTTVTNTAIVEWNAASQSDSATVSLDVGGSPGIAMLSGRAWHDVNNDKVWTDGEQLLDGWSVEIYRNDTLLDTVLTDFQGRYQVSGLAPNDTNNDDYGLRFVAPGQGSNTAALGVADSIFTNGLQRISEIKVASGSLNQDLNMPILPNGVIYDALQRIPVAGATVTMLDAGEQVLPQSCFDDPSQQNQVTRADGFYRFDTNFSEPLCPPGSEYLIRVTPPSSDYETLASLIIPPQSDASTPAFSVPACLGSGDDAVPATADLCEVVTFAGAPPISIRPRTPDTDYHLHLLLDDGLVPGESQLFNNHIPLDPVLSDAVAIAKTSSRVNVSRGELVPYTITVNNSYLLTLEDLSIVDTFPPGFKYVEGSGRLDGEPLEPAVDGNRLYWEDIGLATDTRYTMQLLFIVGAGVSDGDYVNRAQVMNTFTGSAVSERASATVRVVPDPTFDCTDVIGKVFDDKNLNGYQDEGESGLPGVRLINARGLTVTSDEYGRFHLTCAVAPNETLGSNYILKLDDRSLPSGYRITTENPRVQKLTRGKMMKFNFGATIHHVVRLDLADGVFESHSDTMRRQWQPRIDMLLDELRKAPSVLRLSYLADVEREDLVNRRLAGLKHMIADRWKELDCCYRLTIETEVYWRRGTPPPRTRVID